MEDFISSTHSEKEELFNLAKAYDLTENYTGKKDLNIRKKC